MILYNDSELISQYQNGNENALSQLIERHQENLFSFIYYKVLEENLANDIFQETFLKIIVTFKKGTYNEEGKFLPWAKCIAYNLVIDYFRQKNKRTYISETTFSNEELNILDLISENSENIEERLISQQIYTDIKKLILLLPENQQLILKLRYDDGLSFKEISEEIDTSINTTLGRVRYAIRNLRKLIEKHQIILTR